MNKNFYFLFVFVLVIARISLCSIINIDESKEIESSINFSLDEAVKLSTLESTITERLNEFIQEMEMCNNYTTFKRDVTILHDSLKESFAYFENCLDRNKIEKFPDSIIKKFEEIGLNYFDKYKDQHLEEEGILLKGRYCGCFWLYIETIRHYTALDSQNLG